jgi:hypothetical protein
MFNCKYSFHCQVFDVDRESVPMFVYDLSDLAGKVLLSDRLLFTVCEDNNQVTLSSRNYY